MDAIWIKGHTLRTNIVNKQHNQTYYLAGLATKNNDTEFNKFPLYDEDFLVFDNKGDLIECDVKLAAIQRAAQTLYINFREKHIIENTKPSTLIDFTDTLIKKLEDHTTLTKIAQPQ